MPNILTAQNISKIYTTDSGVFPALTNVTLSLEEGGFYSLIGRSGSGKSTLLHILSGLDTPTSGTVSVQGTCLSSYTDEKRAIFRRRYMGFVFQQYNLLEEYDIRTNICMPLRLDGRKPDEQFLAEITDTLGLSRRLLLKYPNEISGGERQRAAIARSILAKPYIIFADEPTGNLDYQTGLRTAELLFSCAARFGQTLFVATHDLELARKADHMLHLEDGKLVSL